jgi:hypothetical protein
LLEALAGAVGGAGGLANLSLAKFLQVLASKVGAEHSDQLAAVAASLKEQGLDGLDLRSLLK